MSLQREQTLTSALTMAVLYFSLNYLERSAVVSNWLDRYGNEQKSGMCLSGWEWRSGDVIGVMTWEIKFALIFWHIRGLCTIKTPCKFHSLKPPPHYKQSIYLIKLQKQLVWIWGARWHHRGTNICINIASRARHWRIVIFSHSPPAFSRSTAEGQCRVASKENRNYNHCHYLVYSGYSIQMRVHFLTQSTCLSLSSIAQMEWKNIRFNTFDLNSSFVSLYRYQ